MKMVFTNEALEDLDYLRQFLERKNPEAAKRKINGLMKRLSHLKDLPRLGRKIEADESGAEIREWIAGDWPGT